MSDTDNSIKVNTNQFDDGDFEYLLECMDITRNLRRKRCKNRVKIINDDPNVIDENQLTIKSNHNNNENTLNESDFGDLFKYFDEETIITLSNSNSCCSSDNDIENNFNQNKNINLKKEITTFNKINEDEQQCKKKIIKNKRKTKRNEKNENKNNHHHRHQKMNKNVLRQFNEKIYEINTNTYTKLNVERMSTKNINNNSNNNNNNNQITKLYDNYENVTEMEKNVKKPININYFGVIEKINYFNQIILFKDREVKNQEEEEKMEKLENNDKC